MLPDIYSISKFNQISRRIDFQGNVLSKTCRSSHQKCSQKKLFLKISQYSLEKTCAGVSFLMKIFEHLFWKKSVKKCFWTRHKENVIIHFVLIINGELIKKIDTDKKKLRPIEIFLVEHGLRYDCFCRSAFLLKLSKWTQF